ncbi:MAG: hypothetical protein L0H73_07100 [Nitrococcus sp.]|nr:hypothetical protein [Nitrococcus sp.]
MPPTAPKSAAARKREQRRNDRAIAREQPPMAWPRRVCFEVLLSASFSDTRKWAAWKQLGLISGWDR